MRQWLGPARTCVRAALSIALCAAGFSTGAANAQQPIQPVTTDRLNTPAGILSVKRENGRICDGVECSVVRLGQTILAHNWSAGIVGAYPSADRLEFVTYYTHGGGNCCLPTVSIVDVSVTPFHELGGLFVHSDPPSPTIKQVRDGLFEFSWRRLRTQQAGRPNPDGLFVRQG